MIKGIYGINIAVKDLEEATKKYESVFGIKSVAFKDEDFAFPGLTGSRFDINGFFINLVSYKSEKTSIAQFLNTKGEGLFLITAEVDDIERDVEELKSKGVSFAIKDIISEDFGKVTFVHPKSMHGVQIEIYQPKK